MAEILRDPYVLSSPPATSSLHATPRRRCASWPASRSSPGASVGEPETYLRGRVPDLNVVFRSDDNGTLIGLVAEGLGYAVVPQLVVNPRNPAYVALPFGNRIPPRHLAIVWHRDRYRSRPPRRSSSRADPSPASATVQRFGGQYVATTGPMNAERGTGAPRARVARADAVVAHHEVLLAPSRGHAIVTESRSCRSRYGSFSFLPST